MSLCPRAPRGHSPRFSRSTLANLLAVDLGSSPIIRMDVAFKPPLAGVREAQGWSAQVVDYSVHTERVALAAESDRLWLRLECSLDQPIPEALVRHSEFLCFSWPIGGVWKRLRLLDNNRTVVCVAHKRFQEAGRVRSTSSSSSAAASPPSTISSSGSAPSYQQSPPQNQHKHQHVDPAVTTLFGWEMQLGTWESSPHWFAMDVRQMVRPPQSRPGVAMKLFAGLAPTQLRLEVHSITAVEIAAQSFTADVTWELTIPAITMTLEENVHRELLDLLDFNHEGIEFVNAADKHSEKPVTVTPSRAADYAYDFADPSGFRRRKARVYDIKYSRRTVATFNEEMSMYYFPFDQQKLTFTVDLSRAWHPFVQIAPAPVDAASFAFRHFKLSNVFGVVFGEKVFVGNVTSEGATKSVRFELMLERKSGYYLTNVVIPAGILTYMSFISYAPLSNGLLMDTSSRLQIVTTLLLTCVTFKYNITALIPQVSYFTWLGQYLFLCFMVMCVVVWENAMFPIVVEHIQSWPSKWHEGYFLWLSFGLFTFGNVMWGIWVYCFVKLRARRAQTLVLVHEHIRVIAPWRVPFDRKRDALMSYLSALRIRKWLLPQIETSQNGDLYVVLPSDSPTDEQKIAKTRVTASDSLRMQTQESVDAIQSHFREFFASTMPDLPPLTPTSTTPTSDHSIYSRIGSLTDQV